jgi:hypothetical protein
MNERIDAKKSDKPQKYTTGPDGETYKFDSRRQIYRKQNGKNKNSDESQQNQTNPTSFRDVNIRRDWWVFGITTCISLATYILIAAYTYFAGRQVDVSDKATSIAQQANREASRSLQLTLKKMDDQVDKTGQIVTIAQEMYEAADRPYIGPNGGIVQKITSGGANGFDIHVVVKNFGISAGEDFTADWDMRIDGVPISGQVPQVGGTPHTFFPGAAFALSATIGSSNYSQIMDGREILQFNIWVKYRDATKNYYYCERQQFVPGLYAFVELGPICKQPWNKGVKR